MANVENTIRSLVLSLSDQQLLTGIAMLTVGWIRHDTEKVYHFEIITDLTWLSSNAHQMTLWYLRDYFIAHPADRNWRVVTMLFLGVNLYVATFFAGHRAWFDSWAYPSQCFFDDIIHDRGSIGGQPAAYSIASQVLLLYGYSRSILPLYPQIWEPVIKRVKEHPGQIITDLYIKACKAHRVACKRGRTLQSTLQRKILGSLLAICDVLYNIVWHIVYVVRSNACGLGVFETFTFGFGTYGLWTDRYIASQIMEGNESDWGFGQLVAILIIPIPVFPILRKYYGRRFPLSTESID